MPEVSKLICKVRCIVSILIFFLHTPSGKAQGLKFSSNNSLISKRTSYRVFTDTTNLFESKLHIDFDLLLTDQNHLGYIMLITDRENSYTLSYLNTRNTSSINFNIDRVSNKLSIPLKSSQINQHKWVRVDVDFDLVENIVVLTIDHRKYTATGFQFNRKLLGNIVFGKNQYYTEVPDMAIKNLHIRDVNSGFAFPLNEWRGNVVHSAGGDPVGAVENPIWLINNSYFWKPVFEKAFNQVAGLNFDPSGQQLFIYQKDSLLVYHTQNNTSVVFPYENKMPIPMILGKSIYNIKEKKCYVYDAYDIAPGKPSVAALDLQTRTWKSVGQALIPTQRHHHNVFYNGSQDTIFLFGGYGAFKYHDTFFKYNRSSDKWEEAVFTGDKINPRFFSAVGTAKSPDEVFIFGGYGNESGDQVVGGKEFYDLYRVNTKTHIIKKCWNIKNGKMRFVPANNLILSADEKYFYALCYPHETSKTHLRLYRFSVENGSYEIVSAPIPVTSEKIETDINLFYDGKSGMFFCAVQEFTDPLHSHIKVYNLTNPPVSAALYHQAQHPAKKENHVWLYITVAAGAIIILGGGLFLKKRKPKRVTPLIKPIAEDCTELPVTDVYKLNEAQNPVDEVKTNAVYLLGEFAAFDHSGREISYMFSPKIRQLFLLILLSGNKGISSKRISLILWPDKEYSKTKNLRGVTFNHLRSILSDIKGIQLQFTNDVYLFITDNSFFCDYLTLQNNIEELFGDAGGISKYYHLLTRGGLLADMNDAWLDPYKQSYDEKLIDVLSPYLNKLYQEKQMKYVLELARLILQLAPFNDEAFQFELKAVKKLKGIDQARKVYDQFTSDYLKSLGEAYSQAFEDIA